MKRIFRKWNVIKSRLNDMPNPPFFHEREIWFCHLGKNIAAEENGSGVDFLRPVIILKKLGSATLFVVPLTRTPHLGNYYFPIIDAHGTSFAMLAQTRVIDARRLYYKSRTMPEDVFQELKSKFVSLFL